MGLESATFIDDLVVTNPLTTDKKKQGDDHFRLIKSVLKNSIKGVTRAFYIPTAVAKVANYSVLSTDDNTTFVCDTSGGSFTLTLPTLASSDKGWCVYVLKTTTDMNPVYLAPPAGTINGYTKVRRSVPHIQSRVYWTGSVFVAQRQNSAPISAMIPFFSATLPPGHLWPDGTTFLAADYVELNTVLGTTTKPFMNGRVPVCKNNLGGVAAGVISGGFGGLAGDTLGDTGGFESHTLSEAQMPVHSHGVDEHGGHRHSVDIPTTNVIEAGATDNDVWKGFTGSQTGFATTGITINDAGSGSAHSNLQPSIIVNYIMVAE